MILSRPPDASHAGFTLLEMMVALAVMALLVTVAVPGFGFYRQATPADGVAQEIEGVFVRARLAALSTGADHSVDIDLTARTVSDRQGSAVSVPGGISAVLRVGRELIERDTVTVTFFPDGASTGLDIRLADQRGQAVLIQVSWLTGLVSVSSLP
jgi:general secretion pathway protein H